MNERDWADRFTHDIDSFLDEAGRVESEAAPVGYRQTLDLARTLATTDLSDESQVHDSLRRRLLNQVGDRDGWSLRKEIAMGTRIFLRKRRLALALVATVLAAILVVTLAWPGTLTAAAQAIEDFVQSLRLGPHTSVRQVDPKAAAAHPRRPPPATPEVGQLGDRWIIRTSIGNWGGDVPPGWDGTVHRFDTLDSAQTISAFKPRQPGYLPDGYALREAMVAPGGWFFLFYDGPAGEIILVQMPVYERVQERSDNHIDTTVVGVGILTEKPIQEVTLNGQTAGWAEGNSLMWEADGVSYSLGGANLTLDGAMRIAESLE